MTAITIVFQSPVTLSQSIMAVLEKNEKLKLAGKEELSIIVDFYSPVMNPNVVLGAFDILSFHQDIKIKARIMSAVSLYTLAITAGLPEGSTYISKSAIVFAIRPESSSFVSTTEIKIGTDARDMLHTRINSCISSAYDYTIDEVTNLYEETAVIQSDELVKRGLILLEKGVSA